MTNLHVVAANPEADDTVDLLRHVVDSLAEDAATAAAALDDPDIGDTLTGNDLVALLDTLTHAAADIKQATTRVQVLGNRWCWQHGTKGRATIGEQTWKAAESGSAYSLKEDGKRAVAAVFFDRLARHVVDRLADLPADDTDEDDAARTDRQVRLAISIAGAEAAKAFSMTPRVEVLAAGLDERHPVTPGGIPWAIDPSVYATPTTGAGPVPTFKPVPTTSKENHQP